ncbi:DNA pilot protein [Sigmofec virus UA08Rod_4822]|uniref:DNA pilot protein n=1 Tax=Sigmofec virus UA08Rod_4822 TaxID=2929411 RepID=A0A976N205_9VIRU|nr:DNA pilot protein [Sigmofec virus UA08Rod_4822]
MGIFDGAVGGAISGGMGLISAGINAAVANKQQKRQHKYNKELMGIQQGYQQDNMALTHQLNEESADNADARTRALKQDYWDMYESPEAQRRALEEAGLGVGMMYGGGAQGMGMSNPQGAQAAGAATGAAGVPSSGLPHVDMSGLNNLALLPERIAQIDKLKEEARALKIENDAKEPVAKEKESVSLETSKQQLDKLAAETQNVEAKTTLEQINAGLANVDLAIKQATSDTSIKLAGQNLHNLIEEGNLLTQKILTEKYDRAYKKKFAGTMMKLYINQAELYGAQELNVKQDTSRRPGEFQQKMQNIYRQIVNQRDANEYHYDAELKKIMQQYDLMDIKAMQNLLFGVGLFSKAL